MLFAGRVMAVTSSSANFVAVKCIIDVVVIKINSKKVTIFHVKDTFQSANKHNRALPKHKIK